MSLLVSKLARFQPRLNLPEKSSSKRTESILLFSFLRWYEKALSLRKSKRNHIFIREIDLNGYGISDLMMFEYPDNKNKIKNQAYMGYITTFELKIKDWKKALKQAIRYKYYSNRVIVILPQKNIKTAKFNKNIFIELNVGLWSFNKKENKLEKIFTPRFHKPLNYNAKEKVLSLIYTKFKSL